MYNADFNAAAYEEIMLEAGLNRFIMSVKQWVSHTNSKGIIAKADGMEEHAHIKILRLSLQAGYLRNSNYILLRNLNG